MMSHDHVHTPLVNTAGLIIVPNCNDRVVQNEVGSRHAYNILGDHVRCFQVPPEELDECLSLDS